MLLTLSKIDPEKININVKMEVRTVEDVDEKLISNNPSA